MSNSIKYHCNSWKLDDLINEPFGQICYLYGQNFASVERNYFLPRFLEILFQDVYRIKNPSFTTLSITTIDRTNPIVILENQRKLDNIKKSGTVIFVSSLGSSIVSYLNDIFFSQNLDCLHINGFSTAVSLSSIPNLLRILPEDTLNVEIFIRLSKAHADNVVIVSDSGLWSSGLSRELLTVFTATRPEMTVVDKIIELSTMTDNEIISASNNLITEIVQIGQPTMLIYIIDSNRGAQFFDAMIQNPNIPDNLRLLFGDAGINYPRTPELINFFNKYNARIIQPFRGNDPEVIEQLQIKLDISVKEKPVVKPPGNADLPSTLSYLATYTITAVDLAYYISLLPKNIWVDRRRYLDLVFDRKLNVVNAIYGIDQLTGLDTAITRSIGFVYQNQIYLSEV